MTPLETFQRISEQQLYVSSSNQINSNTGYPRLSKQLVVSSLQFRKPRDAGRMWSESLSRWVMLWLFQKNGIGGSHTSPLPCNHIPQFCVWDEEQGTPSLPAPERFKHPILLFYSERRALSYSKTKITSLEMLLSPLD